MKRLLALALLVAFSAAPTAAFAQADVIVGALPDVDSYNPDSTGRSAFALGTTSCNIGTVPLLWIANNNQHPVIGQNIYRVKDGVFQQIGVSWLKHGFTALQMNECTPCNPHPNGSQLGVGCSDPYSAGLNGSQGGLGPRYQVNPVTGNYPFPFASPPRSGNDRRILVDNTFLNPATNSGSRYFGEGQYIAPDDAAAGNGDNNASYRELVLGGPLGSGWSLNFTGLTVRTQPAIMAWPTVDRFAQVVHQNVVNDGRIYLGFHAIPVGNGYFRYVYAIHNLNSDRAVRKLTVSMPAGFQARNFEFRNVAWHSGETWLATPWNSSTTANSVVFESPHTFASNPNGSAVRWGSTFTMIFEANADPRDASLELFKPGTVNSINFPAFTVFRPGWQTNSPEATLAFDGGTNDPFLGPIEANATWFQTTRVGINGIAGAGFDVFVSAAPGVLNGLVTPGGQIVNLDLLQPITPWFGSFQTMPQGGLVIPLVAPNVPVDLGAQMLVLSPSAPDGFVTSAMNEWSVRLAAAPTVSAVTPLSASAGSTVTVTGTGFRPLTSVTVGGTPATVVDQTATQVRFTMPAGTGCDAALVITNPDGQSVTRSMSPSPAITNVLAPQGTPRTGGTIIALQGTGLGTGYTVTVGGTPATVLSGSATVLAFRLPAGSPGPATVVVTSPSGCTGTTSLTYL